MLISFSPILVKYSQATALAAGFYRNLFGLLFLLPMVVFKKERWYHGIWTVIWPSLAGALFFIDLWSWHTAIGYIGPGLSTLLGNFQVFFVTLFSILILKERPTLLFLLSVPLALFGVYLIAQDKNGANDYKLAGIMLCLLAAFCYAFFLMINRKAQSMPNRVAAEVNLLYLTACSGLLFAAALGASGESFHLKTSRAFWSLLAYGFFPHFIGWIIITQCLPLVKASVAGITLLLQPVLTFGWEVLLFEKQFEATQLLGGGIVILAVYLATVKTKKNGDSKKGVT
ncbi:MAG: DMT family transporter [Deltaproteobacteria bacterium]|nr:DMT family transporter [Deltaproteobacteria bacterium]